MPRYQYTIALKDYFSEQERVLLKVLLDEINVLRQAASLPPRTAQQLQTIVHQAMQAIRRGA